MEKQIKIGNTVRLKGQPYSPSMTITGFTDENEKMAICQHFTKDTLVTNMFHIDSLVLFLESGIGLLMEYIEHLPSVPKNEYPANVSKEVLVRIAQNIARRLNLIDEDEKFIAVKENIK